MVEVHRFVADKYAQKFPELDSLIPQPMDYIKTIQVMQNEMVRPLGHGVRWATSFRLKARWCFLRSFLQPRVRLCKIFILPAEEYKCPLPEKRSFVPLAGGRAPACCSPRRAVCAALPDCSGAHVSR